MQAVTRFTQLADESDDVPTLRKKRYMDFRLLKTEWDQLKLMHEVLQVRDCCHNCIESLLTSRLTNQMQEPSTAQQQFSLSKEPTVSRTIPVLEFLQQSWGNMATVTKFHEVEDSLHAGLKNLEKWYRKTNDTNVYFICLGTLSHAPSLFGLTNTHLALDPNWKLVYTEEKWDCDFYNAGVAQLEHVVCFSMELV